MKRIPQRRTLRASLGAGLIALALAACSDDGGGGDGGGGIGGLIGGVGGTTEEGAAAENPFQTTDEGARPSGPDAQPPGDGPDAQPPGEGPDRPIPSFGGNDTPVEDDPTPAPPVTTSPGEPVLGRLQNSFVSEDDFDLWLCAVPQIAEVEAVGYVYVGGDGAIVLVSTDGETESAGFSTFEPSAGTVVNEYVEAGVTETLTNFGFSGTERFEATSDLFGEIACERFFVDEEVIEDDGPSGTPVSELIENTVSSDGSLLDLWVCQGPQLQVDANLYVFLGTQGLFGTLQGEEISEEPVVFDYSETSPGSLTLAYQNGDQETLGGITFTSEEAFDATSSFDGPMSCELVTLAEEKRSAGTSGALASLNANVTSKLLAGALTGAVKAARL